MSQRNKLLSQWLPFGIIFLALAGLAIYLNIYSSKIPDTDSFYHMGHAAVYAQDGIFENQFPWTQFSVIGLHQSDIWYGFHILLIPFTYISDEILGLKVASMFYIFIVFLIFAWSFFRIDRPHFYFWLALFLASSPTLLFRLSMLRPHSLTLALSMFLFVFLITRGRPLAFAFIGFAFSWIHLSMSWLLALVYLCVVTAETLVRFFRRDMVVPPRWREGLFLLVGVVIGVLARPNPLGALKIAYIQVVEFFLEKQSDLPIQFGAEMLRLNPAVFFADSWPILIVFVAAMIYTVHKFTRRALLLADTAGLISSLALTFLFMILALVVASRSLELALGFAIIFIVLGFRGIERRGWVYSIIALIIAIELIIVAPRFAFFMRNSTDPQTLKEPALWLKENALPETVVFHPHWDNFAQLFFWNKNNYYINGMDPIFEYSLDPALYWKTHYYAIDKATALTCGEVACSREMATSTEEVLKNEFHAKYVLLQKRRTPNLYGYMVDSPHYEVAFENKEEVVFRFSD